LEDNSPPHYRVVPLLLQERGRQNKNQKISDKIDKGSDFSCGPANGLEPRLIIQGLRVRSPSGPQERLLSTKIVDKIITGSIIPPRMISLGFDQIKWYSQQNSQLRLGVLFCEKFKI